MRCSGEEVHEHFSLLTETYVEHKHVHDPQDTDYNRLHHHPPVDHHNFSVDDLENEERDTGRKLNA